MELKNSGVSDAQPRTDGNQPKSKNLTLGLAVREVSSRTKRQVRYLLEEFLENNASGARSGRRR